MKQKNVFLALLATLIFWLAFAENYSVTKNNIEAYISVENYVGPATVGAPDNFISSGVSALSFGQIVINISSCLKEKNQLFKLFSAKYYKNGRVLYSKPFSKSRTTSLFSRFFLKAIIINCTLII